MTQIIYLIGQKGILLNNGMMIRFKSNFDRFIFKDGEEDDLPNG